MSVDSDLSREQMERLDLARKAFAEFYPVCFWSWRRDLKVGAEDIPEIARGLRRYGGRRGFILAEQLCR